MFEGLGATLWPAVLGLLLAKLEADNIWVAVWSFATLENALIASFVLGFVLVYGLLFLVLPFRKKRGLFLAPLEVPDTWSRVGGVIVSRSVYDAESELFSRLAKSKRSEFPLDWFAMASFCFGLTVLGVISIIPAHGLDRVIFAIEAILVFVAGILGVNKMWQRSPR